MSPSANPRLWVPNRRAERCVLHTCTRAGSDRRPETENSVSLLIDVPLPSRVVVGMIAHRMRAPDPLHEAAHFAVDSGSKHQMVMVGHELVCEQLDLIAL